MRTIITKFLPLTLIVIVCAFIMFERKLKLIKAVEGEYSSLINSLEKLSEKSFNLPMRWNDIDEWKINNKYQFANVDIIAVNIRGDKQIIGFKTPSYEYNMRSYFFDDIFFILFNKSVASGSITCMNRVSPIKLYRRKIRKAKGGYLIMEIILKDEK